MTDLEITKLCAEALYQREDYDETEDGIVLIGIKNAHGFQMFDPIHDDAQAMALVKKFNLHCCKPDWTSYNDWTVSVGSTEATVNHDLNRAICECVAKMQAAKKSFDQPHPGRWE